MDRVTEATVAAIRTKIPNLGEAKLSNEYFYHSLPLCVIDAVFSIGVRYINVQKVVEAWCRSQEPAWPKFDFVERSSYTISDFMKITDGLDGDVLSRKFFGGNRQRTSTRGGILKAEATVHFAKALQAVGVEDFPDIRDVSRAADARKAVAAVTGQGSGISFDYFLMLAGDDSFVKADRMIRRFVAEASGLPQVIPEQAQITVAASCRELVAEFPNLTPRLLDHLIWNYQRGQLKPAAVSGTLAKVG